MQKKKESTILQSIKELEDEQNGLPTNIETVTMEVRDVPDYKPDDLIRIRKKVAGTKQQFAALLDISTTDVESWENGSHRPSDVAKQFYQLLDEDPHALDNVSTEHHPE
ncbi:hypothetical protein AYR62_12195 [Secundilactobacillus paracollinoides]|uniref:helix-turn-helix domain-containing protein n=1 Tax=Secundilactobacillus paracollinoides TaxID=240427 RepID=UPI0006D0734C|nr:transcriptional regulator [Secundilactobacillus paracollinoides]ANZ60877.1 hypothetical protein AYR61_05660 [Secundilactobacillus paracollinoides]ANZ64762.1 hypothetical protein AYR62_12195 [Secundilactobacillus paracollinoides]KRL80770.1 hypothetical protein FC17_GL003140 [Secundilactobacillus paracollinoides DSM 15502 = JCM 11969]